jgi:3-oxoacyl-[acyl-carrier-protein] synthase-3
MHIISTAFYAPRRILHNSYFDDIYGQYTDAWILEQYGIAKRCWCLSTESTSDLCFKAAARALYNAELKADDLDLIIVATDTPEFIAPSCAAVLQNQLQSLNALCFDINAGSAGFVTAFDMAARWLMQTQKKHALIIGAYAPSKFLNVLDKNTATLFGDGAGAVIIQNNDSKTQQNTFLFSSWIHRNNKPEDFAILAGGTRYPTDCDRLANNEHLITAASVLAGPHLADLWLNAVLMQCRLAQCSPNDIDLFFLPQLSKTAIETLMVKLDCPPEKAPLIMQDYGYTGCAAIPMAMAIHTLSSQATIPRDALVFMLGAGPDNMLHSLIFRQ